MASPAIFDLLTWHNVIDYGAKGDGSTNDTTAIQHAITAAAASSAGGVVYFPAGTYMVTTLSVEGADNVLLLGAGPASVLKQIASTTGALLTHTTSLTNFRMQGLRIDGNRANQTTNNVGLLLALVNGGLVDVQITSCRGIGLELSASTRVQLERVLVTDCGNHGFWLTGCAYCILLACTSYDNCKVQAGGTAHGVYLSTSSTDNVIVGLVAYDTGVGAAKRQGYGVAEAGAAEDRNVVIGGELTGNATGATSLVGASSRAETVNKDSQIVMAAGSAPLPGLAIAGDLTTGWYQPTLSQLSFAIAGTQAFTLALGRLSILNSGGQLALGSPVDVFLARDAANVLALRNGANAQTFRIYGSNNNPIVFGSIQVSTAGALSLNLTEKAPGAPTVALAGLGAGNVDNGAHSYKVTFISAHGETDAGTASAAVTVVDKTANGQVALSAIPTGSAAVTSRKLYRTVAGDTGSYLLLATIADNTTTTYTDNTADSGLGAAAPSTNTAVDTRWQISNAGHLLPGIDAGFTIGADGGNAPRQIFIRTTDFTQGLTLASTTAGSSNSPNLTFQDNQAVPAKFYVRKGGDFLAFVENGGNVVYALDMTNYAQLSYGPNGSHIDFRRASILLSGLSGASVTAAALIPAASLVLGVTVRVTTAITGAASFSIGDGVDVDAWGAAIATALNTTTSIAHFTAGNANPKYWIASNNVVLTANGGNFTGGAVRVTVHYITLAASTS